MTKKTMTLDETEKVKGTELFTKKPVEETPFEIIHKDYKYFVSLGQYRLTEEFETENEAKEWINKITWNKILNLISLTVELLTKNK